MNKFQVCIQDVIFKKFVRFKCPSIIFIFRSSSEIAARTKYLPSKIFFQFQGIKFNDQLSNN